MIRRNPIQLNKKLVVKAVKNTKSLPNRVVSPGSLRAEWTASPPSASSIGKVNSVNPGR